MSFFKTNRTINRLHQIIDDAVAGYPIENHFDENKVSSLETKLSHYLIANNITKRQLTEEKSKINALISDISHQTKTPLSNILLYTQLLSESDLSPRDRGCIVALEQQTEKLVFLISSLVKASQLESGMMTVLIKENSIKHLIDTCIRQIIPKSNAKNITISYDDTDAKALFDLKWMAEALDNILDNAIKYTSSHGSIAISVTTYQLFCKITVIDNGIGIPKEELSQIFSRFYRAKNTGDLEGVGLGLYLSREIIVTNGGYVKVNSEINQGTEFSIFLPLES